MRYAFGVILLLVVGSAQAVPIEYAFEGVGSGTLAGNTFINTSFEFRFLGDTDDLYYVNTPGVITPSDPYIVFNDIDNGQFSVAGFGSGFLTGSWEVTAQHQITFYGPSSTISVGNGLVFSMPIFDQSYHLEESYYSLADGDNLPEYSVIDFDPLQFMQTSAGQLNFTGINSVAFTATVVPIPAAVWLFGSGLGLLGWFRRKAA
jgi:hypothetical protein